MFLKLFAIVLFCSFLWVTFEKFRVGTGIHDVTGGISGTAMHGYAQLEQLTRGIHFRLYSRAFIFVDETNGKRFCYVVVDIQSAKSSVTNAVIKELSRHYGSLYTHENVNINGQHTHSGAGGYSHHILYSITSLGFSSRNFNVIVRGIVESIKQAHESLKPSRLRISRGKLEHSNINRSPTSYEANPMAERRSYPDGNVNKDLTVLKIVEDSTIGRDMAAISWFSVHSTSMSNKNRLINGDNKGVASYLFEKRKNQPYFKPGQGPFLAAFPMSPGGDVSPNLKGPFCPNGSPCDINSTCNGNSNTCHGIGPGKDIVESTFILGSNQFTGAFELFHDDNRGSLVEGPLDYRYVFVNMSNLQVDSKYTSTGRPQKTCRNALGMSFAAGCTDGPGGFFFQQGNNQSVNPFWEILRDYISKPTPEQVECHKPKPIFLDAAMTYPYEWSPTIVPVQLFRLGQILFVNLPGEFTTMAGRRIERMVRETAVRENLIPDKDIIIVITTESNEYCQYTTTYEEYLQQRYEAASVLYGPHTLAAYQQVVDMLVTAMAHNKPIAIGQPPPDLSRQQLSFLPPVIRDTVPDGKQFGSVHQEPQERYRIGDTVVAIFWSGHLDNGNENITSFLFVEKRVPNSFKDEEWLVVMDDSYLETMIHWERVGLFFNSESRVTVSWFITAEITPGEYRIRHQGFAKLDPFSSKLTHYVGTTKIFTVVVA